MHRSLSCAGAAALVVLVSLATVAAGCLQATGVADYKVDDNASSTGGADDSRCPGAGSPSLCETCCASAHPDGKRAQLQSLQTCACVPDVCQAQCADTFCRDALGGVTTACDDCVAATITSGRCAVDPTNPYVACLGRCPKS